MTPLGLAMKVGIPEYAAFRMIDVLNLETDFNLETS